MNFKSLLFFVSVLLLIFISNCVPPTKKDFTKNDIDFSDPTFRKILEYQNKRLTDSVLTFVNDKNPLYRYAAIQALGSIGDTTTAPKIVNRLHDEENPIRVATAHTLGLLGNPIVQDSLIKTFGQYDTLHPSNILNEEILESLGKIGDKNYLKLIATVKTYRPSDSLLIMGQVKSIYRFMQRKIWNQEGSNRMESILSSARYPRIARYFASEYFVNTDKGEILRHRTSLINQMNKANDLILKKNIVLALGKTGDDIVLSYFINMLNDSVLDATVKQNIFKSLDNFQYENIKYIVMKNCLFPDNRVSISAAEYFLKNATARDVYKLKNTAENITDWQTKSTLYQAMIKAMPNYYANTKAIIINQIRGLISTSTNPYEKAAYLRAIGYDMNSIALLKEIGLNSNEYPVKIAAMESLGYLLKSINVNQYSSGSIKYYRSLIAPLISESLISSDYGLVSATADALLNSKIGFKEEIFDNGILDKAIKNIQMPRDYESLVSLKKLEAAFKGTNFEEIKPEYNNPMDWTLFDELKDSTEISIKTNKGEIKLLIFKKLAPETVVNFVKNIKSGNYNDKYFHRVVPNFVIQSGCSRGDGYGSGDFTIRTEQNYLDYDRDGYIGMASSGKDTESLQWFITLGPAPRLDTRYTLFGKVISDKKILYNILIGDKVEKISILQ